MAPRDSVRCARDRERAVAYAPKREARRDASRSATATRRARASHSPRQQGGGAARRSCRTRPERGGKTCRKNLWLVGGRRHHTFRSRVASAASARLQRVVRAMPLDPELHKVAKDGDVQACIEILQAGADVNAIGAQGRTALHRALAGGYDACAATLLDSGADVTIKDAMCRSSLVYACLGPEADASLRCVTMLFEKQEEATASVLNAATKSGSTALHCAVEKRALDLVRFLVERGADAELRDEDGKSSVDLAKEAKLPKDLFSSRGAKNERRSSADSGKKRGSFFKGRRGTRERIGLVKV